MNKLITVFHFETGVISVFTMAEILQEINRDRSDMWVPYNETDYREGLWCFTEYRFLEEKEGKRHVSK